MSERNSLSCIKFDFQSSTENSSDGLTVKRENDFFGNISKNLPKLENVSTNSGSFII